MRLDHLLILNVSRRNGRRKERIYLGDIPSAFKGFQHLLRLLIKKEFKKNISNCFSTFKGFQHLLRLLIYYTRTHAHRGRDIQTEQTQTQTQTQTRANKRVHLFLLPPSHRAISAFP